MELYVSLGGILCIYLGYRLFIIGTNQPFRIFSDLQGWKFKAAIISPGIFLGLLGSLILCSPVITNIISIFQSEQFINSYATKIILEELRKKNKIILSYNLDNNARITSYLNDNLGEKQNIVPKTSKKLDIATVTCNVLRLRKRPSIHHQVIGYLRKGNVIIIKEEKGLWLRVSTDDYTDGWVHRHYVKRLDRPETKEQAKPPNENREMSLLLYRIGYHENNFS